MARCADERVKGRDMSAIIEELRDHGYKDEEVKGLVRGIDAMHHSEMLRLSHLGNASAMMFGGAAMAFIGTGVTIASYIRVFDAGGVYVVFYGTIITGALGAWYGWAWRKRLRASKAMASGTLFAKRFGRG